MPAELTLILDGKPTPVYLGESGYLAGREADRAAAAADEAQGAATEAQAAAVEAQEAAENALPLRGTSWNRPAVPIGKTALFYDVNRQERLTWAVDHWVDPAGAPAPTPAFLLDEIATAPLYPISMNRRFRSAYTGPLFRVSRVSDSAVLDAHSAAEADAFDDGSGLKVQGTWIQTGAGVYRAFSSPTAIDYGSENGLAYAVNGTESFISLFALTGAELTPWGGLAGAAGFHVIRPHEIGEAPVQSTANAINLFFVSTATSGTAAPGRIRLYLSTSATLAFTSRSTSDDETAGALSMGSYAGGIETVGFNINVANATGETWRYGRVQRRQDPYLSAGTQPASAPLMVNSRLLPGVRFYECCYWNVALSDAERDAVLADQRAAWGIFQSVRDGATSWWNDPFATGPDGYSAFGYSTREGQFMVAELDADGVIIATKSLGEPLYGQDDHVEASVHYANDGSLLVAETGHRNAIADADNDRVRLWFSESGRIADLALTQTFEQADSDLNYAEWLEGRENIVCLTSSDFRISWLPLYSVGKDPGGFVAGRDIIQQLSAPGGGENQNYARAVMISESVARMVCTPHPSNIRNQWSLLEMNVDTGDVWADTAETVIGNFMGAGGPLVEQPNAPVIYTPPLGKSARLMQVSPDGSMICGAEYSNPGDDTDGVHFILVWDGVTDRFTEAAWTKRVIGPSGLPFFPAGRYFPALDFAREPHRGLRLYRTWNDGAGTWELQRLDSRNGGLSWSTSTLYSVNATADFFGGEVKLPRCWTAKDAAADLAVAVMEGPYNHYRPATLQGEGWLSRVRFFGAAG